MADSIQDITPEHHPVAMLRDCMPMAQDSVAGAVILLDSDGKMHLQNCGVSGRDLLWALKLMEATLIADERGDRSA